MSECDDCPGLAASAVARTMTTVLVALASVVVMALGGCASPRGIEPKAALIAPAALGADAGVAVAPVAPMVARLRRSGLRPDRARDLGSPTLRSRRREAPPPPESPPHEAAEAPQMTGSFDATRKRSHRTLYPRDRRRSGAGEGAAERPGSRPVRPQPRAARRRVGAERAAIADDEAARVLLAVNVAALRERRARSRARVCRARSRSARRFSLTRRGLAGLDTAGSAQIEGSGRRSAAVEAAGADRLEPHALAALLASASA